MEVTIEKELHCFLYLAWGIFYFNLNRCEFPFFPMTIIPFSFDESVTICYFNKMEFE